jgi:competence protein ComEC
MSRQAGLLVAEPEDE